jgi:TonB family protein
LVQGSGARELDRAAVEAVRRWRFAPATRGGQPVEGSVQVPITFNLK